MQHPESLLSRTLAQLERGSLPPSRETDTHLVRTCLDLMQIPIGQLTTENLRMLILQDIGLKHLIPLALDKLETDPFAAGDYYDGDLLHAVVRASVKFWSAEPQLRLRLDHVISSLRDKLRFLERDIFPAYTKLYEQA
jgi:hypothetical protein